MTEHQQEPRRCIPIAERALLVALATGRCAGAGASAPRRWCTSCPTARAWSSASGGSPARCRPGSRCGRRARSRDRAGSCRRADGSPADRDRRVARRDCGGPSPRTSRGRPLDGRPGRRSGSPARDAAGSGEHAARPWRPPSKGSGSPTGASNSAGRETGLRRDTLKGRGDERPCSTSIRGIDWPTRSCPARRCRCPTTPVDPPRRRAAGGVPRPRPRRPRRRGVRARRADVRPGRPRPAAVDPAEAGGLAGRRSRPGLRPAPRPTPVEVRALRPRRHSSRPTIGYSMSERPRGRRRSVSGGEETGCQSAGRANAAARRRSRRRACIVAPWARRTSSSSSSSPPRPP